MSNLVEQTARFLSGNRPPIHEKSLSDADIDPYSKTIYSDSPRESKIGVDIKFRLTPSSSLDVAINPDFGQVEMDPEIINLTAYETYLPEKRTFFNEINSLFNTPIEILYSRRIGGHINGMHSKITSATRFFGKSANGYQYGLITANSTPDSTDISVNDNTSYYAARLVKKILFSICYRKIL